MQRVLCIYLPGWDIALAQRGASFKHLAGRGFGAGTKRPAPPTVLTTLSGKTDYVCRCCPNAARAGVTPGLSLAEARVRAPRLYAAPMDTPAARQALEKLAIWCGKFSPRVALDDFPDPGQYPPASADGLFLDFTGMGRRFGDEAVPMTEIAERLRRGGFFARLAVAPSVGAAWALAHYAPDPLCRVETSRLHAALAPLSVAALRLPETVRGALAQTGVTRIEALLNIARPALHKRFGPELLTRIDQALGVAAEPLVFFAPALPWRASTRFEHPVEQWPMLEAALRELLDQLVAFLRDGQRAVRVLQITFAHERRAAVPDSVPPPLAISLSRPTRDAKHLWSLLYTKLETVRGARPIVLLELAALKTVPVRAAQTAIWPGDDESMRQSGGETIDHLDMRLGPARVRRMEAVASHMAERSRRWESFSAGRGGVRKTPVGARVAPLMRPAFLLPAPEPVEAQWTDRPETAPPRVTWRGVEHAVAGGIGPERIATEWWHGQPASTRDYFLLQTRQGQWLWVFRVDETRHWFIQGIMT